MPLSEDLTEFSTTGPANTIFAWEDVIASIGYKTFFALRNNEGDSLVTSTVESNDWATLSNITETPEMNFDHTFLAAADIEGSGFVNITGGFTIAGASDIHFHLRLIHVDTGNNETEIVATIETDGLFSSLIEAQRFAVTMNIPETHFSIGEKLRLEVIMHITIGGSAVGGLWHDPAGRGTVPDDKITGTAASSTLQLTIPFRLPLGQ